MFDCLKRKNPAKRGFLLPDLDSNQDKQNQNLSYYHYTIGQPNPLRDAKIGELPICSKFAVEMKKLAPAVGLQRVDDG